MKNARGQSIRAGALHHKRRARETWRLALNLSLTAGAGGILFILVGAWLAAWITFALGASCAIVAGMAIRHGERARRLPAAASPSRPIRRGRA